MNIDHADYKQLKKPPENPLDRTRANTFARQAVVHAKQLTGSPPWDRFLSMLQHDLNGIENALRTATDTLIDQQTVNTEQIMLLKMKILEHQTAKNVMQRVMSYPKRIIDPSDQLDNADKK